MKQQPVGMHIAVALSVFIAAPVVFFWVRELDLSFLARYRLLCAGLVTAAGVTLGIACGRWLARVTLARRAAESVFLFLFIPRGLLWIFVAVFAGVAVFMIPHGFRVFLQAAAVTPLNLPSLTGTLFRLLNYAWFSTYMLTLYGLRLFAPKEPVAGITEARV